MFNYELPNLNLLVSNQANSYTPEDQYILRQLNSLLTQKQNLHGRRIGKAKDAIAPGDYVTKRQLNGTLVGTLAQRPQASNVVVGTTYFATDRNVTYIMRGGHWYYYSGIQDVTLSPNTKPSPSILYDSGYMIYSTDFDWYYRWNLITWERLHGTSGAYLGFPANFTKVGWHKLDGATVNISNDDGTVTSIILDNFTIPHFIKYGFAHGDVAAVTPTISGSTGATSNGHTHNVTAVGTIAGHVELPDLTHGHPYNFTTDTGNLTLSGNVNSSSVTVTLGSADSCSNVSEFLDIGSPVDVADCFHSHSASGTLVDGSITFGSSSHTHSFEGSTGDALDATLGVHLDFVDATFTGSSVVSSDQSVSHTHTGSSLVISNDGSPLAHQLIPYIRL